MNDELQIGEPDHEAPKDTVLLSNRFYEWFKKASLFVLPALAAAYFGIAQIWGLPNAEEVVGTVAVLETFLGVILRVSQVQYDNSEDKFDGRVVVTEDRDEDGPTGMANLNFSVDPTAVYDKDEVLLKVKKIL